MYDAKEHGSSWEINEAQITNYGSERQQKTIDFTLYCSEPSGTLEGGSAGSVNSILPASTVKVNGNIAQSPLPVNENDKLNIQVEVNTQGLTIERVNFGWKGGNRLELEKESESGDNWIYEGVFDFGTYSDYEGMIDPETSALPVVYAIVFYKNDGGQEVGSKSGEIAVDMAKGEDTAAASTGSGCPDGSSCEESSLCKEYAPSDESPQVCDTGKHCCKILKSSLS